MKEKKQHKQNVFWLAIIIVSGVVALSQLAKPNINEQNYKSSSLEETSQVAVETSTSETTPTPTTITTETTIDEETKEKERIEKIKNTISITNFTFYEPNSAGGVEVEIDFNSKIDKEIKYVYFYIYFFNRAEDLLVDNITGVAEFAVRSVGPFNQNDKGHGYWGHFYNYETYYSNIQAVEVHFTDGTLFTISGDDIQYINNWN